MESPYAPYFYNGTMCCLCFLMGTLGNIVSFLYFKSKKRDISNMIYMLITANDMVVGITVLPVGISFLTQGQPGFIFGNKYGCVAWQGVWEIAISLSVFLVLCLCITRTISLLRPFKRQKIRYLLFALLIAFLFNLGKTILLNLFDGLSVKFLSRYSRSDLIIYSGLAEKPEFIALSIGNSVLNVAPVLTVFVSCVISVVVLTRRNRNVQQKELQQSRNRATVTILLFALLYGVCNIPLVVHLVIISICLTIKSWKIYDDVLQFDEQWYYQNAMKTILVAANSAANPILYFWRMPALRGYIMSGIRTKQRS